MLSRRIAYEVTNLLPGIPFLSVTAMGAQDGVKYAEAIKGVVRPGPVLNFSGRGSTYHSGRWEGPARDHFPPRPPRFFYRIGQATPEFPPQGRQIGVGTGQVFVQPARYVPGGQGGGGTGSFVGPENSRNSRRKNSRIKPPKVRRDL